MTVPLRAPKCRAKDTEVMRSLQAGTAPPRFWEVFDAIWVAFSGGHDSLWVLLWTLARCPREHVRVIFADTRREVPETYAFLFGVAAHLHLDITVLLAELSREIREHPERRVREGLFQLIRLDGHMPSGWGAKWCTDKLKLQMCHDVWVREGRPSVLWLTGQRREESARRRKLPYFTLRSPHTDGATFRPALDLTRQDRDADLLRSGVPLSVTYEYLPRTACGPCVNGTLRDYVALGLRHPAYLAEAADLERAMGQPFHSRLHSAANALAVISEGRDQGWDDATIVAYARDVAASLPACNTACTSGWCHH